MRGPWKTGNDNKKVKLNFCWTHQGAEQCHSFQGLFQGILGTISLFRVLHRRGMSCPHVWPTIEPNWSKPPWRIIVIHILIIFFPVFLGCTSFPPDLSLNNFYCDINLHQVIGSCLHLFCIVIPIIGSATSVNLKKTGMASRNTVMKKQYSSCILISFAVVFGLLVFGSSYFGWLDLFSRDLTFIAGSLSTVFWS